MDFFKIISEFKKIFKCINEANKHFVVEKIEFELQEMQNVFTLLLFGAFIGIPLPPSFIALELFPYMEEEIFSMLISTHNTKDMLAILAGKLDGF
ncbi:MAG: hypothetical protein Q9M37_00285 [Desulfonauticus sp.]|nr:hypothetical protein [Desulfonauticus sp.]